MIHTDGKPTVAHRAADPILFKQPERNALEENLTAIDFLIQSEGNFYVLHPCNDLARQWIADNFDPETPTWGPSGVVIDYPYFGTVWLDLIDQGYLLGDF